MNPLPRRLGLGLLAVLTALAVLLAVSNRRVLGQLGRWNLANSPWVKVGLAVAVIAMSFGLLISM